MIYIYHIYIYDIYIYIYIYICCIYKIDRFDFNRNVLENMSLILYFIIIYA